MVKTLILALFENHCCACHHALPSRIIALESSRALKHHPSTLGYPSLGSVDKPKTYTYFIYLYQETMLVSFIFIYFVYYVGNMLGE